MPATYALDINTSLPEVLSESAPQGYGQTTYTYGLDNIAQTNAQGTQYFLGDAINSTRQLTDASGQVTLAQSYDPFGNVINSTGSGQSIYGYTGEPTDASGLVYLRARYYDSGIGRFFTRDPFSGYLDYPQTQNPYLYGGNNPIRFTDPSGECFDPVTGAICLGALFGGGINLYMQLHNNGGRWDCINWGEVAISAGAGAVAGLVAFYAFPVFLPAVGATFTDFVIAGGMTGIVAGQAAQSSALLFSGHADQIIGSFAQPDDVLNNFVLGMVGGAIGYGIQSIINYVASGLRINVGVPDEFMSPMQTGQWKNWSSTWEQQYYLSSGRNNSIVDDVIAYNQSLSSRPSSLPIDEVFWAQHQVSPEFTDGTPLDQGVMNYKNNPYPIRVFEKQPWMDQITPLTKISRGGRPFSGNWATMNNREIYTLNNRSYTVATMSELDTIPVRWSLWDEIWEYSYQFDSLSKGRNIWLAPNGPLWDGGMAR